MRQLPPLRARLVSSDELMRKQRKSGETIHGDNIFATAKRFDRERDLKIREFWLQLDEFTECPVGVMQWQLKSLSRTVLSANVASCYSALLEHDSCMTSSTILSISWSTSSGVIASVQTIAASSAARSRPISRVWSSVSRLFWASRIS